MEKLARREAESKGLEDLVRRMREQERQQEELKRLGEKTELMMWWLSRPKPLKSQELTEALTREIDSLLD